MRTCREANAGLLSDMQNLLATSPEFAAEAEASMEPLRALGEEDAVWSAYLPGLFTNAEDTVGYNLLILTTNAADQELPSIQGGLLTCTVNLQTQLCRQAEQIIQLTISGAETGRTFTAEFRQGRVRFAGMGGQFTETSTTFTYAGEVVELSFAGVSLGQDELIVYDTDDSSVNILQGSVAERSTDVVEVQMETADQVACAGGSNVTFNLTASSANRVTWSIEPSGNASFVGGNTGRSVTVNPGTVTNRYQLTAALDGLTNCQAQVRLDVLRVELASPTQQITCVSGSNVTLRLTDTSSAAVTWGGQSDQWSNRDRRRKWNPNHYTATGHKGHVHRYRTGECANQL